MAPTCRPPTASASTPGTRPFPPRWSTASTGPARWWRSTDFLPALLRLKSPGTVRGFLILRLFHSHLSDSRGALERARRAVGLCNILKAQLPSPFKKARRDSVHATSPRMAVSMNDGLGEKHMRTVLLVVGLLALAMGLLWIGQGTGTIKWPQTSFMINQIQWAGYGVALAALGLIFIWQAKR